jgi:pyridoxal 5'-phosphate synthase pdxT subunit
MVIGVLALQGDFEAHSRMLSALGAQSRRVRSPKDLQDLDGLVLPGGESTTMTLGVEREGLAEPLCEFVRSGKPVLGTCAGLILLDREHLGLLDISARRNAFGRQIKSFEVDLVLSNIGPHAAMRAVFIRAPWVADCGAGVEILAQVDGHPVAVRHNNVVAVAFHPELAGDDRLHEWLVDAASLQETQ